MKLLKDYDYRIKYHLGRANVVADALSRKTQPESEALINLGLKKEVIALRGMNVEMHCKNEGGFLATLRIRPSWVDQVVEA